MHFQLHETNLILSIEKSTDTVQKKKSLLNFHAERSTSLYLSIQKFKTCKLLKHAVKRASSFNVCYLGSASRTGIPLSSLPHVKVN